MSRSGRDRTRGMRRSVLTIGACALTGAVMTASASAAITPSNNPDVLAEPIAGGPVTGAAINASVGVPGLAPGDPAIDPFPMAVSDTPLAGFPTAPPTYTIITSGDAELADNPNTQGSSGPALGYEEPARGEANDPATLSVPFTTPPGTNCLSFDYKFLSEEFPEFVNAGFNDAFIAELDGSSWFVQNGGIVAPGDFAAPKGDRVSVDTVGPTSVLDVNAAGTTYDAATGILTTKALIAPGAHNLVLSVFDSGDSIFDSAAFVDGMRFTNETPETCKPPDIFAGQVGISVTTTKFTLSGSKVLVPITCLLQVGITVNCEGLINLKAKFPKAGNKASRAKAKTIGTATYSVAPGASAEVPVKLSKKARKALKQNPKLKGKATVTNASNGAAASFKIVVKKKRK